MPAVTNIICCVDASKQCHACNVHMQASSAISELLRDEDGHTSFRAAQPESPQSVPRPEALPSSPSGRAFQSGAVDAALATPSTPEAATAPQESAPSSSNLPSPFDSSGISQVAAQSTCLQRHWLRVLRQRLYEGSVLKASDACGREQQPQCMHASFAVMGDTSVAPFLIPIVGAGSQAVRIPNAVMSFMCRSRS